MSANIRTLFFSAFLVFVLNNISVVLSLNESFERSSILYGISVQAAFQVRNNGSKNECYKDLTEFYDAAELNRVWAFKMMDVSGRPNQGFLVGNNGWTGQCIVCADLTNTEPPEVYRAKVVQLVTDYDFPPYELGFVTAFLRHDNKLQLQTNLPGQNLIQLGLCTPLTCTGEDIQPLLEVYFQKRVLTFQKLYDTNFKIERMKTISITSAWLTESTRNIIILAIILGVIFAVFAISYYDLNIYQTRVIENNKTEKEIIKEKEENKTEEDLLIDELRNVPNIYDRFLLCFSWNKTYRLLLESDVPDEVGAINGLMFFGIIYVAVYNYFIYGHIYSKYLAMEFRGYESFFGQIIVNSTFSIDTILFLNGCLISYNFYKLRRDILINSGFFSKIWEIVIMIVGKIFRALPVYIMCILWTIYLFSYVDSKWPAPLVENPQNGCPKNWWQNLMFINNLFPIDENDSCMTWTWLIAADMQYYVLNVFLLILSTFCIKLSAALIISIIGYSIYSTGLAAYSIGYVHTIDQQLQRHEEIYLSPYTRVGPYAVGMLTGLILYKLNGKLSIKKKFIWLCWTIAPMINFYLIFGLTGYKPSTELSSLYIAFGRVGWAAGIAWILIACSTDNAGYLSSILSYSGFKLFHKLAYSSYLFMVTILLFVNATFDTTIYISTLSYVSHILSVALFPYLINTINTLFYEIPFELLWKTFIRK